MLRDTEVVIVPYRDGPYLVRGPVVLRDQDGNPVSQARRPIALCRCGKSQLRPFCDGTHQLIGFTAPSEAERPAGAASFPAGAVGPPDAASAEPLPGQPPLELAVARLRRREVVAQGSEALQCVRGALRLVEERNPIAAGWLVRGALDALADTGARDASDEEAVGALRDAARELGMDL